MTDGCSVERQDDNDVKVISNDDGTDKSLHF